MRDNYSTFIRGRKVTLVPYKKMFVDRYNQWMQDPFLQEMTASEPLTLQEEYEMQESWRDDQKKCTFIVLCNNAETTESSTQLPVNIVSCMAGDVNMFLNDRDDPTVAELEVMIAEERFRRKGLGQEAVELMMHYGITALGITRFYVKINQANTPSLDMFRRMGFVEVNYVPAFEEYELQYTVQAAPGVEAEEVNAALERRETAICRGSHGVYGVFAHSSDTEDTA